MGTPEYHAVAARSPLQPFRPLLSVAILMGFAIVHGVRRYGWRHFITFFFFTFVISWSYETSSILSGFPFGHYYYTGQLGLKLWLVSLLIVPAYFSMGYLAWTLAHIFWIGLTIAWRVRTWFSSQRLPAS